MLHKSLIILVYFFGVVAPHSWMSCPSSLLMSLGRGGVQSKACDGNPESDLVPVTQLQAGDRLKIGWPSNNHAGGYVRLSLVSLGQHTSENFQKNVLKFVCYGSDMRVNNIKASKYGDCYHPCNARPGCEFQSESNDCERYDTTIGIPTNLKDGDYVLQAAMLVGNSEAPYYSCARLKIIGGNPSFNCFSKEDPITYSCLKSNGPALESHFLKTGSTRGDFCYHINGSIGGIDDDIYKVPINVECDPRISCMNSVDTSCETNNPSMKNILTPGVSPKQPNCNNITVTPYPLSSCNDKRQNRDEEGIDCGGAFCEPCPTLSPNNSGSFDYFVQPINQTTILWGQGKSGGMFQITVMVKKDVSTEQCWQLTLQYGRPLLFKSDGSTPIGKSVWNDGVLVYVNPASNIITIEKQSWSANPKTGQKLIINFVAYPHPSDPDQQPWTNSNMKPLTASFEIKPKENCFNKPLK
ncbi:uncharacterized protein LOC124810020 isoform X1 [Hydra vulgaris]|uniref:uncharacterized protein LOC124810020 isoform X1 n=1 Tax=Hydra vulgaris TaxID=6087 RepID=UPI001F5E540C|nr:uncharacterized protein LOC124810020 [Hydra vulgaris]